ncbi:MAG: retropepsin-like aspartic protease [Pseudomonadota bacterium]
MRLILGLVLLIVSALSSAQADTQTRFSLPILLDDDRLKIQVEWGGHPIRATLDTAATYPLINASLLSKIEGEPLDETVTIFGVGGVKTFPVARTGELRIDRTAFRDVLTAVTTTSQANGIEAIIPVALLPGRTLDFQFRKKRLEIYNTSPKAENRTVRSRFAYETIKGVPFIEVQINGVKGLALVDTGSDVTYINREFARQAKAVFLADRTLEIFGTGPDESPVQITRVKRFTLGDHRMESFELLSANTTVFDYLDRREEPTMVLGMDTLGQLRLQIDRQEQEIFLSRRADYAEGRRYSVTPFSGRIKRRR